MASYTVTVEAKDEVAFAAYCASKGYADPKEFVAEVLKSHVDTANAYAAQSDEAAKAAKVAQAEAWEPVMTKYTALPKEKQDQVDAILATAVQAPGNDEPIENP